MNLLNKVAGGGVIGCLSGIGIMTLCPILAPVGALSLAGCLLGAGAGGLAGARIGAALSDDEEKAYNIGKREGAKAGEAAATLKYKQKVEALAGMIATYQQHERGILGLYAVGLAVITSGGLRSHEQEVELEMLVAGLGIHYLPQGTRDEINRLRNEPPSLEEALQFARNCCVSEEDIHGVIHIFSGDTGYYEFRQKASAYHSYTNTQ